MSLKNLTLGIVLGVALAAGIWFSMQLSTGNAVPNTATVLPAPRELPDFSLLDHNGKSVGPSFFDGQWDLVFFGFTHCPDICPLTLQVLSSVRTQIQASGESPIPRIVLVSVDPERDNAEALAQYISNFGDGNAGVTGDLEELRKLTDGLGVFFEKRASDDDNYAVDHTATVFLIDPDGRYHALFSAPHKAENFVHDLPLLTTL